MPKIKIDDREARDLFEDLGRIDDPEFLKRLRLAGFRFMADRRTTLERPWRCHAARESGFEIEQEEHGG
jgi:hypothetical protein